MMRSIMIFPKFSNMELIDKLRKDYDPLVEKIPAHITVVFPFESSHSQNELKEHIQKALKRFKPFDIRLTGITGAEKGYLFLNVKKGNDQIIELHDRLYSGILATYLFRKTTYFPHLTVGRLKSIELYNSALQMTKEFNHEFVTTVEKVELESIDEMERSRIEYIHKF